MNTNNPPSPGKKAATKGTAGELRLLAKLLEQNYIASIVQPPNATYDILAQLPPTNRPSNRSPKHIRIQVKTASNQGPVKFTGGVRAGTDRKAMPGMKKYRQSTTSSDVVVGVDSRSNNGDAQCDFYIVPTIFIEQLNQDSISARKIERCAKNNWDLLRHCRNRRYVLRTFREHLPPT